MQTTAEKKHDRDRKFRVRSHFVSPSDRGNPPTKLNNQPSTPNPTNQLTNQPTNKETTNQTCIYI